MLIDSGVVLVDVNMESNNKELTDVRCDGLGTGGEELLFLHSQVSATESEANAPC